MQRHHVDCRSSSRRGMSIIEVIVVIFVLLLLLSLCLPAVQGPRRISRRLECANNLKQLALAAVNSATQKNGKIPLLTAPAPGLASKVNTTWAIHLLPYMDNAGGIEYIEMAKTENEAVKALQVVLKNTFSSLQCPLDSKRFKQPGGLSYGANVGYGAWQGVPQGMQTACDFGARDHSAAAVDWNGNGELDTVDKEVARATGVFWFADDDEFRLTLDDISQGDGAGQTIMFAETLSLPPMHLAGPAKDGTNPNALDAGFGLGYRALGLKKNAQSTLFVDGASKPSQEYTDHFAPNSKSGKAGISPAAASMHLGTTNVVYCDGHVGVISDTIDWAIWASLHTPKGMQHGQVSVDESHF